MPPEATTETQTPNAEAAGSPSSAASAAPAAEAGTNSTAGETKAAESGTPAAKQETPAATVYDLKLPDGSTFDAAFVTRTADTARALGLSNEAGQKLLDAQIAEIGKASTAATAAAKAEQLAAMQPGGAIWKEQEAKWRADALADAGIGGSPEKLQANVDLALKVVNAFASDGAKKFFTDSGLGSHPELVRMFAKIGRSMSEATLAGTGTRTSGAAQTEEERLAKRYPTMAGKS